MCSYIAISIFTDQSAQWILDQSHCMDFESSFAWGWTNQGPEAETWVYISQPLSGTKDCVSQAGAESPKIKHQRHLVRLKRTRGSTAELSSWRGAWPQGRLIAMLRHNWVVTLLSCSTAVLFSQPCYYHNWAVCTESSFPNWGFLLVLNWRQWPLVDTNVSEIKINNGENSVNSVQRLQITTNGLFSNPNTVGNNFLKLHFSSFGKKRQYVTYSLFHRYCENLMK